MFSSSKPRLIIKNRIYPSVFILFSTKYQNFNSLLDSPPSSSRSLSSSNKNNLTFPNFPTNFLAPHLTWIFEKKLLQYETFTSGFYNSKQQNFFAPKRILIYLKCGRDAYHSCSHQIHSKNRDFYRFIELCVVETLVNEIKSTTWHINALGVHSPGVKKWMVLTSQPFKSLINPWTNCTASSLYRNTLWYCHLQV